MKNKLFYLVSGVILITLYYIPILILGQDGYIQIHDNLDGELMYRVFLSKLNADYVPQVMNGLPKDTLFSPYNGVVLLFKWFKPFKAYLINDMIVHYVAFIGMFLLSSSHLIIKHKYNYLISTSLALTFAIVPFYSIYSGLTVGGQPLLLWAFLNIRKKRLKSLSFLIIVIFPFYSSFVLSGIFIIMALAFWETISWAKHKKLDLLFTTSIVILGLSYLFVERALITSFLFPSNFVSHRSTWVFQLPDAMTTWKSTQDMFLNNYYHAGNFQTFIIMFSAILSLAVSNKNRKEITTILLAIISIIAFYFSYRFIGYYFGKDILILRAFQWDRFYFLLPILWFVVFAMSINSLKEFKFGHFLIPIILIAQLFTVVNQNENDKKNWSLLFGGTINEPTFRQFYAADVFNNIKNHLPDNFESFRVASLGLHPSVSQYNGLYTLDSYQTNYSLAYKKQFQRIIQPELDKSPDLLGYFNQWGNRCYLFSSELGRGKYIFHKSETAKLSEYNINTIPFKEMGGQYIISGVEIEDPSRTQLKLIDIFQTENSYYKLYLYSVSRPILH